MEQGMKAIIASVIVGAVLTFVPDVLDLMFPKGPNAWFWFPPWILLRLPGLMIWNNGTGADPPRLLLDGFDLILFSALSYPLFYWLLVWRKSGGSE
jgi:hypothetical protein